MFKVDKFDLQMIEDAMSEKDYLKSLDLIEKIESRLKTTSTYLLWVKGAALDYTGYPMEALKCFKESLNIDPAFYLALNSWQFTIKNLKYSLRRMVDDPEVGVDFIKEIQSFLNEMGEYTSEFEYLLMRNFLSRKAYNEFDQLFSRGIESNPHSPDLLELQRLRGTTLSLAGAN
jgi:tetratricopeptide (TPR) repeat protein